MSRFYDDPWLQACRGGPFREDLERAIGPCWYCNKPTFLVEPGTARLAHKVCASSLDADTPVPTWDGQERESKVEPVPIGCGTPAPGQRSGRACGGTGSQLSCQLCPQSPTYWRVDQ